MSVVAAKVTKDKIIMAADSIVVSGWSKRNNIFSKIVEINGMIAGTVGTAQEGSLMWHYMDTHKPATPTEKDVLAFVVEFSKWKGNYATDSNIGNQYLIAFKGHLFLIEKTFVTEISDFAAIGAGEDHATAALYLGHTPSEAVKVACDLGCYVCEPIIKYEMLK